MRLPLGVSACKCNGAKGNLPCCPKVPTKAEGLPNHCMDIQHGGGSLFQQAEWPWGSQLFTPSQWGSNWWLVPLMGTATGFRPFRATHLWVLLPSELHALSDHPNCCRFSQGGSAPILPFFLRSCQNFTWPSLLSCGCYPPRTMGKRLPTP